MIERMFASLDSNGPWNVMKQSSIKVVSERRNSCIWFVKEQYQSHRADQSSREEEEVVVPT